MSGLLFPYCRLHIFCSFGIADWYRVKLRHLSLMLSFSSYVLIGFALLQTYKYFADYLKVVPVNHRDLRVQMLLELNQIGMYPEELQGSAMAKLLESCVEGQMQVCCACNELFQLSPCLYHCKSSVNLNEGWVLGNMQLLELSIPTLSAQSKSGLLEISCVLLLQKALRC